MAYDRQTGAMVPQKTVAGGWMEWIYQTKPGHLALHAVIKRKMISSIYGWYCKQRRSLSAAEKIIEQYQIDTTPFHTPFTTYFDFFTRKLPRVQMPEDALGAWAEGYISAWENIDPKRLIQVKGSEYDLSSLLQDEAWARRYAGGTLFRIRLAPQHYHHFHWFDNAKIGRIKDIKGAYYSVHPLAVAEIARLYCENKRRIVEAKTERFGTMLLIEVGATMIGSVVNPFQSGEKVCPGEDGGYFAPGGSMILGLFEKGAVQADQDILQQTAQGKESIVLLGERIGIKGKL